MENPATWGPAERVVDDALKQWEAEHVQMRVGLSKVRAVTDALRRTGLLMDSLPPEPWPDPFPEEEPLVKSVDDPEFSHDRTQ